MKEEISNKNKRKEQVKKYDFNGFIHRFAFIARQKSLLHLNKI